MSTTTPSQQPPQDSSNARAQAQLIHAVSLCAVILCPIVLALPPRKLDAYSVILVSGTFVGSNQLAQEYTGRSILTRIQEVPQGRWQRKVAVKERETEGERVVEQGVLPRLKAGNQNGSGEDRMKARFADGAPFTEDKGELGTRILAEVEKKKKQEEEEKSAAEKGWIGGEKSAWKKDRDRREKEALEEGKGYGDMITEQIWEVWNWGRGKAEGIKEADEQVVKEGKEGKR